MSDRETMITLLEQQFSVVDELFSSLDAADWDRPTDCPGWTVKDQLSHLVAIESFLAGRPPAGAPVQAEHVKNEFGALNEGEVEARRHLPGEQILAEWREVVAARLEQLHALDDEAWGKPGQTLFFGEMPPSGFLAIRLLDMFTHEQDARRATGRPGHLDGEVARRVFETMAQSVPATVGKRAAAPAGSTVVIEVAAPGRTLAVGVPEKRAEWIEPPTDPTVRIVADAETFLCLTAGRWTAERALADGRAKVHGDEALGRRILENMTVVP